METQSNLLKFNEIYWLGAGMGKGGNLGQKTGDCMNVAGKKLKKV